MSFDANDFIKKAVDKIKEKIEGKAIIAASGGVDSTVAAKIGSMAIGDDLTAVHVDTGYMRKGESRKVAKMFDQMQLKFLFINASDKFYDALKGVIHPEKKRKIIGEKFARIFESAAKESGAKYLIQGTIAPDWIESGDELRDVIKSHHNVGGMPSDMKMKIVEPLRDLYKDEVRKVARYLELPISERQPFPGPGLAIRIIGEATPERTKIVREACAIVEGEIENAVGRKEMEFPWQYFAVLLPMKTVGVHGDKRAYGYTIAVRAVESIDAMTAGYSKIPHEILERISTRITNEIGEVNRVVFDVTNKPPGTVEWE